MPENSSTPQSIPIPTPISTAPMAYKLTLQFSPWSLSFPRLFLSALASPPITRHPPPPYLAPPGSPESGDTTRPSQHIPGTPESFDTARPFQRDEYDPFLDRADAYSDYGSSGYAESCYSYADRSDEVLSLLYVRSRCDVTPLPPCGEYGDLLDFETPLPVPRVSASPSASENGEHEENLSELLDLVTPLPVPRPSATPPASQKSWHEYKPFEYLYQTPTPGQDSWSYENIYSPLQEYHLELPSPASLWEWRWTLISIVLFLVGWCALAVVELEWDRRYVVSGMALMLVFAASGRLRVWWKVVMRGWELWRILVG
ncbi:uncharacterized protein H6S33_003254 [Morchella sextelata]|uniref:uncharacterized protein n=1 Tax=Morchella sextelata TaxID=1174677 RepID=UPI001D036AA4|nr:uncharacterized protein H6S33_003254 [Morchella sextelata]KAH0607266.1 hypothetical protein H6S33_003254 [Morchella sextelata]